MVHAPPSLGLDNRKFGFWAFIASEVLFFTVLIGNFLVLSGQDPPGTFEGVATGHEMLNIPLTALNTFILFTSSFTVVGSGSDFSVATRKNSGCFCWPHLCWAAPSSVFRCTNITS